ncbi:MAG: nucleoside 2-deoxyribosyltransferase [Dehalococcoidales bacterium]
MITDTKFTNIDQFLALFKGVNKNTNGWEAICPSHEGHPPERRSLSITLKNGKILLKCFAGCDNAHVVESVGLKMADLFLTGDKQKQSRKIEYELAENIHDVEKRRAAFHQVNSIVASKNERSIRDCDFVIGILDGVDVDSGTASEIGFAYGIGKRIFGFRTDSRKTGDNDGSTVNLQVQYWIEKSGGHIATDITEVKEYIANCTFP